MQIKIAILIFLLFLRSPVYVTISHIHPHPAGEEIRCLLSCSHVRKVMAECGYNRIGSCVRGKQSRLASLCLLKPFKKKKKKKKDVRQEINLSAPSPRNALCTWIRVGIGGSYQTNEEMCLHR